MTGLKHTALITVAIQEEIASLLNKVTIPGLLIIISVMLETNKDALTEVDKDFTEVMKTFMAKHNIKYLFEFV